MLLPAMYKKEELTKAFDKLRYSEKMMFYNGCLEDGRFWCSGEENYDYGHYQYAICDDKENLVGYIAYNMDYYSAVAFSFGLISFDDKPNKFVALAIRQVITEITSKNVHRVEFRAISGNPAVKHYDRITDMFASECFTKRKIVLPHTFRDGSGNYRDSYIYEIIHWHNLTEKTSKISEAKAIQKNF